MKIMLSNKWMDNFLDYACDLDSYRIKVLAIKNIEKLKNLYFVKPKNFSLLYNYILEVGPIEVLKKIKSRFLEKYRNEKFISIGFGHIISAPKGYRLYSEGQLIIFCAPCHPPCFERIVLPKDFIIKASFPFSHSMSKDTLLYESSCHTNLGDKWWNDIKGWNPHSGMKLQASICSGIMKYAKACLKKEDWKKAQILPCESSPINETDNETDIEVNKIAKKKRAALFGYGNYAKTIILPNMRPYVSLKKIHEIDPTNIPVNRKFSFFNKTNWDTGSLPRKDEHYDVYLIAGYHHTHTPLAIKALQQGAWAIIEKPITVDHFQLKELLATLKNFSGKIISCFHKRYHPMNKIALKDLKSLQGEPVSYHCIVYEVPLPTLHWYRWPNSKSRIVSNGCHWIDHFLFLNNFCKVKSFDAITTDNGCINCSITLENGAFFTMVLTDHGSKRIGVQDYIELRANGVTVKIINSSYYKSENEKKIIRTQKRNKMDSYRLMYKQIGEKILNEEEGDSVQSVEISSNLILNIENLLKNGCQVGSK